MTNLDHELLREILAESNEDIIQVIGSLANEKRLQLVHMLIIDQRDFGEMQEATDLSKTALVHHLNKLVEGGIVEKVDHGRYEISQDGLNLITSIVDRYSRSERRKRKAALERTEYIELLHSKKTDGAQDIVVEIVELPAMRVASVRVISKSPETDAWTILGKWAGERGLLDDLDAHPVFGFNNPDPSPGNPEYGYEFWIRVGPDVESDETVEVKEFEGGLYAMTTCNLMQDMQSDFFKEHGFLQSWKLLAEWVAHSSEYRMDKRVCLERAHDPNAPPSDLILDLLTPIRKRRRGTK